MMGQQLRAYSSENALPQSRGQSSGNGCKGMLVAMARCNALHQPQESDRMLVMTATAGSTSPVPPIALTVLAQDSTPAERQC